MTVSRSRKEAKTYVQHQRKSDKSVCAFCTISETDAQHIVTTKYFKVIKNIFPYSIWDSQQVIDHLMVTPIVHTDSIKNMSDEQKVEYVDIIETYEQKGYNIYARAPGSKMKSIIHQHTHLIKTEGDPKKFILHTMKPYVRIVK